MVTFSCAKAVDQVCGRHLTCLNLVAARSLVKRVSNDEAIHLKLLLPINGSCCTELCGWVNSLCAALSADWEKGGRLGACPNGTHHIPIFLTWNLPRRFWGPSKRLAKGLAAIMPTRKTSATDRLLETSRSLAQAAGGKASCGATCPTSCLGAPHRFSGGR